MQWITIIGIAFWAILPGFIAKRKSRSFWGYYLLSFVISPLIATIIAICVSPKNDKLVSYLPTEKEQKIREVPNYIKYKCDCLKSDKKQLLKFLRSQVKVGVITDTESKWLAQEYLENE